MHQTKQKTRGKYSESDWFQSYHVAPLFVLFITSLLHPRLSRSPQSTTQFCLSPDWLSISFTHTDIFHALHSAYHNHFHTLVPSIFFLNVSRTPDLRAFCDRCFLSFFYLSISEFEVLSPSFPTLKLHSYSIRTPHKPHRFTHQTTQEISSCHLIDTNLLSVVLWVFWPYSRLCFDLLRSRQGILRLLGYKQNKTKHTTPRSWRKR